MKFSHRKILQSGLAMIMAFSLLSEASFTPAVAGSGVDVYIVFAGKDKKEKKAIQKALPDNLTVKFYNVDLLALADYSGKQKAIAKLEKAKVVVFVKDAPHELLEGISLATAAVIFNSAKSGVQSSTKTLYVVGTGISLGGGLKTHNATEADLRNLELLRSTDAVLLKGTTDIHNAVALVVATFAGS